MTPVKTSVFSFIEPDSFDTHHVFVVRIVSESVLSI
jgi:hypothetical protein